VADRAVTTLPFGRYAGKGLSSIPKHYLEWAHGIVKSARVREAIAVELERRAGPQGPGAPAPQASARASLAGRPIPTPSPDEVPF
jgi:hypothetical protein